MFDFITLCTSWILPIFLLIATYALVHYYFLCDDIQIICLPTEQNKFIQSACPILSQEKKYRYPMFFGWSSFLQIYYTTVLKKHTQQNYLRESFTDPDLKEPITIDWAENSVLQDKPLSTPTIIILPGITGTAESPYIQQLVDHLKHKYRIVGYSRPGCGNVKLTHYQFYMNTHPHTIKSMIHYIDKKLEHQSPLYALGISMGGANIVRAMAEYPDELPLKGIVTINQPLCHRNMELLELQPIYYKMLVSCTLQIIKDNEHVYRDLPSIKQYGGLDALYKITNMREFDEVVTKPIFGMDDLDGDYYKHRCITRNHLLSLKIPLVCIQCADDPVVQPDKVGEHMFEVAAKHNSNIMVIKTEHGSHCSLEEQGWLVLFPGQKSWMDRISLQLIDALSAL